MAVTALVDMPLRHTETNAAVIRCRRSAACSQVGGVAPQACGKTRSNHRLHPGMRGVCTRMSGWRSADQAELADAALLASLWSGYDGLDAGSQTEAPGCVVPLIPKSFASTARAQPDTDSMPNQASPNGFRTYPDDVQHGLQIPARPSSPAPRARAAPSPHAAPSRSQLAPAPTHDGNEDPHFRIRICPNQRKLSQADMNQMFASHQRRRMSELEPLFNGWATAADNTLPWVTMGVLTKKVTSKYDIQERLYHVWELSDLSVLGSRSTITLFLFGAAAAPDAAPTAPWQIVEGDVLLLLNPEKFNRAGAASSSEPQGLRLKVTRPTQFVLVGAALDFEYCKNRLHPWSKPCTNWKHHEDPCCRNCSAFTLSRLPMNGQEGMKTGQAVNTARSPSRAEEHSKGGARRIAAIRNGGCKKLRTVAIKNAGAPHGRDGPRVVRGSDDVAQRRHHASPAGSRKATRAMAPTALGGLRTAT